MEFLKKHYEKVLLGAVLLGLASVAALLPFEIRNEDRKLKEMGNQVLTPRVKPLTNLDLSLPEDALRRTTMPETFDLSTSNKLFNPVQWLRGADGRLIPGGGTNSGPTALVVTMLHPLYTEIVLHSILSDDAGPKFLFAVKREASPLAAERREKSLVCKVSDKNDLFSVKECQSGTNALIEMNDNGQQEVLVKDIPFKRIDGYTADLRYPPETNRPPWLNRRVNSSLAFNGEEYGIVAIYSNEVVLSAKSNQKKSNVPYTPKNPPNAAP